MPGTFTAHASRLAAKNPTRLVRDPNTSFAELSDAACVNGMGTSSSVRASSAGRAIYAPADSAALGATVVQLRARAIELERELEARKSAHQADLEALSVAQHDVAASQRTLRSERAWVSALDKMRILDLAKIQRLETQLAQFGLWQDLPSDIN